MRFCQLLFMRITRQLHIAVIELRQRLPMPGLAAIIPANERPGNVIPAAAMETDCRNLLRETSSEGNISDYIMVPLSGRSLAFEHAIVEGSEREVRGCRLAGEYINKAVTHVHRHRRVAMVEQKIKIRLPLRAARHLDLLGHVRPATVSARFRRHNV